MVFESLFSAEEIESKPIDMLLLSVIISSASLIVSHIIFPEYAGVIFPLLIALGMAPIVINIFKYEEEIERETAEGKIKESFLERHGETIYLFSLFFIGVFVSTFLFSLVLSENIVADIFKPQLGSITAIKSVTGKMFAENLLEVIIINNLKIMLFSFMLSFIFGAGALFILSWNASVLAIFLANFLRNGNILHFFSASVQIIPHAPVEILAYFLAGIAGGMLSAGIIRESIKSREFLFVLKDSIIILFLSVAAVVLGAFVEIYI